MWDDILPLRNMSKWDIKGSPKKEENLCSWHRIQSRLCALPQAFMRLNVISARGVYVQSVRSHGHLITVAKQSKSQLRQIHKYLLLLYTQWMMIINSTRTRLSLNWIWTGEAAQPKFCSLFFSYFLRWIVVRTRPCGPYHLSLVLLLCEVRIVSTLTAKTGDTRRQTNRPMFLTHTRTHPQSTLIHEMRTLPQRRFLLYAYRIEPTRVLFLRAALTHVAHIHHLPIGDMSRRFGSIVMLVIILVSCMQQRYALIQKKWEKTIAINRRFHARTNCFSYLRCTPNWRSIFSMFALLRHHKTSIFYCFTVELRAVVKPVKYTIHKSFIPSLFARLPLLLSYNNSRV